jgi:hypothetical protein
MSFGTFFLIALVLCAVAGVLLLVVGLRGRRVDDHPLCRKCRFNLRGAPASSDRCPECGHDIRGPRGTVVGHHVKRRLPLVAGLLLIVLSLTPMGVVGVVAARGIDWRTKVPTWYVLLEARGTIPGWREAAAMELYGREVASKLTETQKDAFAETLVMLHGDPSVQWQSFWGDFLAQRIVDDKLPQESRERFLNNLLGRVSVKMRNTIRQGGPVAIHIRFDFHQRGILSFSIPLVADFSTQERQLLVDGKPQPPLTAFTTSSFRFNSGGAMHIQDSSDCWKTLAPGTYRVEWSLPLHVMVQPAGQPSREVFMPALKVSQDVTILPSDQTDVKRIRSESLRPTFEAALELQKITLGKGNSMTMLSIGWKQPLPVAVSYKVFVRQNGNEHYIYSLSHAANLPAGQHGYGVSRDDHLVAGPADVIFRPDEEAARTTPDIFEIWDGEIVVKDFVITDSTPTTRAAVAK